MSTRYAHHAIVLLVCVAVPACSHSTAASHDARSQHVMLGAGSTFAAPLFKKWIDEYRASQPDLLVEYDSVGSGEGQTRFEAGTVDFAVTDAALGEDRLVRIARGGLMLPITAGSIALAYNPQGLVDGLKLPREVYCDIFLGKINRWNDPRIASANPGVALPDQPINRIVRLDSSGTTHAFTSHLSAISDAWRTGPGSGKLVAWPADHQKFAGNDRVAGMVKLTYYSLGYVEYGTARAAGLYMAQLENKQGEFVRPSVASARVSLVSIGGADRLAEIHDPQASQGYPIVTCTWLLAYKRYESAQRAQDVKSFARWCLTAGQQASESIGYVPLADEVAKRSLTIVDQIGP
jgi:phosphate transport system substrate-binding protein